MLHPCPDPSGTRRLWLPAPPPPHGSCGSLFFFFVVEIFSAGLLRHPPMANVEVPPLSSATLPNSLRFICFLGPASLPHRCSSLHSYGWFFFVQTAAHFVQSVRKSVSVRAPLRCSPATVPVQSTNEVVKLKSGRCGAPFQRAHRAVLSSVACSAARRSVQSTALTCSSLLHFLFVGGGRQVHCTRVAGDILIFLVVHLCCMF